MTQAGEELAQVGHVEVAAETERVRRPRTRFGVVFPALISIRVVAAEKPNGRSAITPTVLIGDARRAARCHAVSEPARGGAAGPT
ncbi:hypothetical protein I552_4343 [Mycobacterium xenopi 3993]|nr:hypothetical protein I552_4343 [Mycobacterium xenopi 3993]